MSKRIKQFLAGLVILVVLVLGYFTIMPPKVANQPLNVAGGITSETQTMGSMVADMIEHYTHQPVHVTNNLATVTINHQAMLNGDTQVSAVRYTGEDLTTTLGLPAEQNPDRAYQTVKKEFARRYHQTWLPRYGFANKYVFLVRKDTAKKYHLKTISDMQHLADKLSLGVDTAWVTRKGDGYEGFKQAYGYRFKDIHPMQIGLVYSAVAAKKMDVVLGYTTDGRIGSYDLVMLKDDRHFFPAYDAAPVVNNATLKMTPGLEQAIERLRGTISTHQMQKLNYEVDNNLKEPSVVAKEFLEEHNYFEDQGEQ
ncbi:osmoprotectant ABC transporter substrate-binding protein [Weissella halotolerans]|uniref:Glycine betaine carnitine choline ABC transporter n=1 Tax=Weissella halotolerans DSM 20190 TaxID=1123500 RepID=A0A0R2FVJ5_9LACO|nr:osmoprotectant ABC transporter substrate-binding protein [Weissella halotolerans]KRN32256.1 glycine betaine carnitine choline ABC transporter [Weissella halotolerans DSM 20190]